MTKSETNPKPEARSPKDRAAGVCVVLVTAPDLKTARTLARGALAARLIACANLVPRIESHYVWQGKAEQSAEVLMVMKTTRRRLAALERFILSNHPYDTAEFLVLPAARGAAKYLAWVAAAVAD
jgi:periplasmic divalent cation tolerance protein